MKNRKKNGPISGKNKGVVGENVVVPNPVEELSSTSKPKETNFGIRFNYGGTNIPSSKWEFEKYVGGQEVDKYGFDPDRFGYFDLVDEVKKIGYVEWGRLTYRVPCTPLQKEIKKDSCVMEMLKHIVDGYRMLEVFVVDGRKVADVISGLESIDDFLEDEIVGEKEDVEEDDDIEVKAEDDVEEDDDIEVEAEDDVEGDDESGEDDNYVPDHPQEETDDEMEACELVPDDEEYVEARKKKKDDKVVEITDEMFLSTNNADKGINWGDSDHELSDDDGLSDSNLECQKVKERHRIITYDPKCDHKSLRLTVGMSFTDGYEAKAAITDNAVENGWEIHFKRANRQHVEAYCKPPCKWKCFGSLVKKTGQFLMKSVKNEHTCPRAMKNNIVSSNWIARKYLNVFRARAKHLIDMLEEIRTKLMTRQYKLLEDVEDCTDRLCPKTIQIVRSVANQTHQFKKVQPSGWRF